MHATVKFGVHSVSVSNQTTGNRGSDPAEQPILRTFDPEIRIYQRGTRVHDPGTREFEPETKIHDPGGTEL